MEVKNLLRVEVAYTGKRKLQLENKSLMSVQRLKKIKFSVKVMIITMNSRRTNIKI